MQSSCKNELNENLLEKTLLNFKIMLTIKKITQVLFLMLAIVVGIQAQEETENVSSNNTYERKQGYWTFGINGGSSYQSSDVCRTYEGWGLGLTLAKNLYYKPGATFAFDLRGRLLYTNQVGRDNELSYGLQYNEALNGSSRDFITIDNPLNYYNNPTLTMDSAYVANHRTDVGEIGLEGVLQFNKLRERSNVILNLYGGLNLDWYKTRVDQSSFFNGQYDYGNIDFTAPESSVETQLESMWDGEYETLADGFSDEIGTFTWMPSLGFELGYQLTPRFSVVGGHKVTWSRDDILDGQRWTNENLATDNNDIYHYTHLGLRWIISPGEKELEPPIVNIIRPQPSPYETNQNYVSVLAEILNCEVPYEVSATFNGSPFYNFDFNPKTDDFTCQLNLVPGKNTLTISASNQAGSDSETLIVIYSEPEVIETPTPVEPTPTPAPPTTTNPSNPTSPPVATTPDCKKPVVKVSNITNPVANPSNPSFAKATLTASVSNMDSRSGIKLYINGNRSTDFNFNNTTGVLTAELSLESGNNTIKVTAENKCGNDSDTANSSYNSPATKQPPVVNITAPNNGYMTSQNSVNMEASVLHVNSKNDIKLYINGYSNNNFSYNHSTKTVRSTVNLQLGNNIIKVYASNSDGNDEDEIVVTYKTSTPAPPTPPAPTNPCDKPTVKITSLSNPVPASNANYGKTSLKASVRNASKSDIELYVNGNITNNFSYTSSTGVLTAQLQVKTGNSTIKIIAKNKCGNAQDSETVSYSNNAPPPPPPAPTPSTPKPVVTINTPSNNANFTNPNISVKATILHVDSKSNVIYEVNGVKSTSFNFNPSANSFTASLTLAEGRNTIRIIGKNDAGTDSDLAVVNYNVPQPTPPVVTINSPANGKVFTVNTTTLKATVKNVPNKSGVTVKINGTSTTNFNYSNGIVTATVNLKEGQNTLFVKGVNSDGQDSKTHTVRYNPPVTIQPPVVKFTNPSTPGKTVTKAAFTVKASLQNVASKRDITFKVNGQALRSYTYNASTGQLSASVTLKDGMNTFEITGKNEAGSDKDNTNITYKKVAAPIPTNIGPTVEITNLDIPTPTLMNPNPDVVHFKAKTTKINSKANITLKVNGARYTDFNFNPSTGKIDAVIKMVPGKNTYEIKVQTRQGSDTDKDEVTFNK